MTVIEFMDKSSAENLITPLLFLPDNVVYVGYGKERLIRKSRVYAEFFSSKKMNIVVSTVVADKQSSETTLRELADVLRGEQDIIIDITGGDESLLFMMGQAVEIVKPAHVQKHRINVFNNRIETVGETYFSPKVINPTMTVDDVIRLHGGSIRKCTDIGINLDDREYLNTILKDLGAMWSLNVRNSSQWNNQANCLAVMDVLGHTNGMRVKVYEKDAKAAKKLKCYERLPSFLLPMYRAGLISMLDFGDNSISYVYKNRCVHECLCRAGLLFELIVYVTALMQKNGEGNNLFDDAKTGVVLEWDSREKNDGTVNEVDVILMRGMIPIFISCKNGCVDEDELYKLSTVTERFGGRHAKKVLAMTGMSGNTEKDARLLQRAADMGIRIIPNAHKLSECDLATAIFKG